MPRPPAPYNFASIPHVDRGPDRTGGHGLARALARGEGYLGFARNGWPETLGVHMTSGVPEQLIVLPTPTYLPLCTAFATEAAALTMLFHLYAPAIATALVTAGPLVWAGQSAGLDRDYGPLLVGLGVSVPVHTEVAESPPWLALIMTLIADATSFTCLLFGTFYLWISAPNWPAAQRFAPSVVLAVGVVAALIVAAVAARMSLHALSAGASPRVGLALAFLALLAAIAMDVWLISRVVPRPNEHALGATVAALLGYVALHAGVGILFLISNAMRLRAGRLSRRRRLDLRLTRLWVEYTAVTGAIALGLVLALPSLAATLALRR
jgi:cytochrome c oxidase subunit I+III